MKVGDKMRDQAKSYNTGKKNEKGSWGTMRHRGYIRPTPQQRKNIVAAWAKIGKTVHKKGFDLIKKTDSDTIDDVDKLFKSIQSIRLYELKTAGKDRKQPILENWRNLGFTLTGSEKHNAETLGDNFKFLFLNLKNNTLHECSLGDFFSPEVSGIYPTWSIFVKGLKND